MFHMFREFNADYIERHRRRNQFTLMGDVIELKTRDRFYCLTEIKAAQDWTAKFLSGSGEEFVRTGEAGRTHFHHELCGREITLNLHDSNAEVSGYYLPM